MRYIQLAAILAAGAALCAHAPSASAQDDAPNRDVLRALKELRHEVSILKEQNHQLKTEIDELKEVEAAEPVFDINDVLPLDDISAQRALIEQQASRIDELEAGNISLRKSVDEVVNRPPPAPPVEATMVYECVEPVWLFEAGYINWRTRRSSMPYAGALNLGVGGSFTNNLRETEYDRDAGFRIAVGRRNEDDWDVMFRYTHFENGGSSTVGDAANMGDAVFANQLDRSLVNLTLNLNFDDGRVDAASEDLNLKHYVYDLELGRTLEGETMQLRRFGGLRIARITQDANILYQNNIAANNVDSYTLDSNVDMTGLGLRTGAQFDAKLMDKLSLFGRGAGSLMLSEFSVNRADTTFDQSAAITRSRSYQHKYRSIVPVMELATGLRYESGNFFIAGGYEYANWFNMYQHLDITAWDDVDGQTSPIRSDRGDLSFDGWFIDAGFTY